MSQVTTTDIEAFFQDPNASSAVVLAAQNVAAPMIQGTALTTEEAMMGGGVRVVMIVLDGSPSMLPMAAELRKAFNDEYVPAVMDAREGDISALRVGGCTFSSDDPTPIWRGADGSYFHPIGELPELTVAEYDPNRGWGTALHNAILHSTGRALAHAAQMERDAGIDVDVDVLVLSDGANNEHPRDPSVVKAMIQGSSSRVRHVFFYFETQLGLSDPESYAINKLGYDGEQVQAFMAEPNETPEERAQRFRRLMQVMSRVSASRGTSAVMATAAVLDDDELV